MVVILISPDYSYWSSACYRKVRMAAPANQNLDEWVSRIQKTRSGEELVKILEQFRKLEWTELERQRVSHAYMRVLEVILKSQPDAGRKVVMDAPANDGPVWYEKM